MGVSPFKKTRISQASQRAQPDAASGIPDVAASPGMQLLDLFLGAANQERQGAGHEKLGKSETTNIMTYYDILRPYHIINKSDKSGGSSKQMQQKRPCLREANQTLSGQTDLEPDVRRFRLIHNGARSGKKIYHQK